MMGLLLFVCAAAVVYEALLYFNWLFIYMSGEPSFLHNIGTINVIRFRMPGVPGAVNNHETSAANAGNKLFKKHRAWPSLLGNGSH